jgi:hypothetical protein
MRIGVLGAAERAIEMLRDRVRHADRMRGGL